MKKYENPFEVIYGVGAEADIMKVKSNLLIMLTQKLRNQFKTRKEMAEFLETSTSEVSKVMTGKLGSTSIEKILKYLYKMNIKIDSQLGVNDDDVKHCLISLK